MVEFDDLEREFAEVLSPTAKRGIHSLGKKLPGITREVEHFFQDINENISIPDMEELSRETVTIGGPDWDTITPAIFGGGIFTFAVISIDVVAFIGLGMSMELLLIGLVSIPFHLFAIAALGAGIGEYLDPTKELEQVMVRNFYHHEKGLIMVIRNVYNIKKDSLRSPRLVSFTYVTRKHYIRIYCRKPYTGDGTWSSVPTPGGSRVCICIDENNSTSYSVLYSCGFHHKKASREWAKFYSELLGIPFVGETKVKRIPWNPLSIS